MNRKKDNKLIIFGLIVVVVLAIIAIVTKPTKKVIDYETMTDEEINVVMEKNIDTMLKNKLSALGEKDRMEYYISTFIKNIENKRYEEAYKVLYDDFKINYFPTLESFESYAKSKFPKMCSLEFTNIERNGEIYVLWVSITNSLSSQSSSIDMNFVVKENALNDFVMSFSVK